jgi:phosphatidylserine/phosphatidylglycerophosphate/cardiolipin synthase-like enzyme
MLNPHPLPQWLPPSPKGRRNPPKEFLKREEPSPFGRGRGLNGWRVRVFVFFAIFSFFLATIVFAKIDLFVEPAAGRKPILDAINSASHSIRLECYMLTDFNISHALRKAAKRGLDVRVILDAAPGGDKRLADNSLAKLSSAGVRVRTGNPDFPFTHEKALVIDNEKAFIMTLNLSKAAFGKNREFGVITDYSDDVMAIKEIFESDWDRSDVRVGDNYLVYSPGNARTKILSLIDSAAKKLEIYNEELQDKEIEEHLLGAIKRGCEVRLILPPLKGKNDPNMTGEERLLAGGVKINVLNKPYVHAKMILADGRQAFVGSQNFSATSLDRNRELGILVDSSSAIKTLEETFTTDWQKSQPLAVAR